jgi:hypothetical protein
MMFEKTAEENPVGHFGVFDVAFERCRSLIDPVLAQALAAHRMDLPSYFLFGTGEVYGHPHPGQDCMRAFAYRYGDAAGRRNATNLGVSRIIGYGVLASILWTAAILTSLAAVQCAGMFATGFVRRLPAWLTAFWRWLTY